MRVLMVLLALAVTPLVAVAAQSRDDKCADPRGRAVGHSQDRTGKRGNAYGHDKTRGVVCPPDAPLPPPTGEDPPPVELAEIHGMAFGDVDASFKWSDGETGLEGWVIELSGPVTVTDTTDAFGNYSFVGLAAGTYLVCQALLPISYWQSVPMEGVDCGASGQVGYTLVVVSPILPGTRFLGNDFGNVWLGF